MGVLQHVCLFSAVAHHSLFPCRSRVKLQWRDRILSRHLFPANSCNVDGMPPEPPILRVYDTPQGDSRLVDVGPQDKRGVVRKKLQRQREDERCFQGRAITSACSTWFFKAHVTRRHHDNGEIFVDERDRPVLQLSGGIALSV